MTSLLNCMKKKCYQKSAHAIKVFYISFIQLTKKQGELTYFFKWILYYVQYVVNAGYQFSII